MQMCPVYIFLRFEKKSIVAEEGRENKNKYKKTRCKRLVRVLRFYRVEFLNNYREEFSSHTLPATMAVAMSVTSAHRAHNECADKRDTGKKINELSYIS